MNYHVLAKLVGLLLMTYGASMAPSLGWALWASDGARVVGALAGSMALTVAVGGGLFLWGRRVPQDIFRKEATATVGLGWALSAAFGALPYYFAGALPSYTDCYFEAMSGLTTTGASVLLDIEALPRGLLFWRSFTHWLGGLGIIMLFVAILPYLGAGGRALVRSEVTGPVKEGLTPRIKDTARLLYKLYIGYTIVQTILLVMAGMTFFDALCHTFGTLATGGFSTQNASVAAYDSVAIEAVIIVFMFLAGTNFALMHGAMRGRPRGLLRDPEWRVYCAVIAFSTLFITLALTVNASDLYDSAGRALRDALFTVLSILTTTGYVTADFEAWPIGAKCLLAMLMFVGGCAGSTGGGMKVMRWIILFKIARLGVERIYRPRTIRKLKMGGQPLDDGLQGSILVFSLLWLLIFMLGSIAIAVVENGNPEIDLLTSISVVSSTLNNIGPGFAGVAATENYAKFSDLGTWFLSLFMVLGRLEIYSILVLFAPRFWRED